MILTHMSAQMLRRARETGYEIAEDGETVTIWVFDCNEHKNGK